MGQCTLHVYFLYFRLLSCVLCSQISLDTEDPLEALDTQDTGPYETTPLELSDIMPLATKTYDKMRPPKFKGKTLILTLVI